MVRPDGAEVAGLFTCTSAGVARTEIQNTSSDVVWVLAAPGSGYWAASDDALRSLKVQLFRAGIRQLYAVQGLLPRLTLEPGSRVQLPSSAGGIRLTQAPEEQAAWQVASATVDAATKKATAVARQLVVNGSPTRNAVITCVEQGYAAGKALETTGPDPADQLETTLGLRDQYGACVKAIDDAENAEKRSGSSLVTLTRDDVATTMQEPAFERRGSVLLDDAVRGLKALPHL